MLNLHQHSFGLLFLGCLHLDFFFLDFLYLGLQDLSFSIDDLRLFLPDQSSLLDLID